ncbi:hypothetical protein GCM10010392_62720 [Streptomyces clavifer]|nr:hypothetical protein GCM10010392_62720 [Streptomyces clavifer]
MTGGVTGFRTASGEGQRAEGGEHSEGTSGETSHGGITVPVCGVRWLRRPRGSGGPYGGAEAPGMSVLIHPCHNRTALSGSCYGSGRPLDPGRPIDWSETPT